MGAKLHQLKKSPERNLGGSLGASVKNLSQGIDEMDTTSVAVHNQPTPTTRRAFGAALCMAVAAPAVMAAAAPRALLWRGSNLGLGRPTGECYVLVEEDGVTSEWTIAQTVGRLGEFSEAAKTRIAAEFGMQLLHL